MKLRMIGRVTAAVLAAALVLSACGGGSGNASGSTAQSDAAAGAAQSGSAAQSGGTAGQKADAGKETVQETTAPAPVSHLRETKIEPQEIWNDEETLITANGSQFQGDDVLVIPMTIENKSKETLSYMSGTVLVNGLQVWGGGMYADLTVPGAKADAYLTLDLEELDTAEILEIGDISLEIQCRNGNYDAKYLEDVKIQGPAPGAGYGARTGDPVLYDGEDATISFLKTSGDQDFRNIYLLVENHTDQIFTFWPGEAVVNDSGKIWVNSGSQVDPGKDAIVNLQIMQYDLEQAGIQELKTMDLSYDLQVGDDFSRPMPVHISWDGDAVTMTAEKPDYDDDAKAFMAMQESRAAAEAEKEALMASVKPAEVKEVAWYVEDTDRKPGVYYTAVLKNPNEKVALVLLTAEFSLIAENGSVIETQKATTGGMLLPGQELPLSGWQPSTDAPVKDVQVTLPNDGVEYARPVQEFDVWKDNTPWIDEELTVKDWAVSEAYREEGVGRLLHNPKLTGTLVNPGDAAQNITVIALFYGEDGKLLFGWDFPVNDVPAGGEVPFEANVSTSVSIPCKDVKFVCLRGHL